MPKKTPAAQLDREIAQALRRKKPAKRAHAAVKTDKKQADVLMVANDAALSDQYDRAEQILSQGKQRTIATAFTTVTPESAEAGDFADRGWEDEEGDEIEVDASDIENEAEVGSQAPVTWAIVNKAVRWLRDQGASETSSSSYHPGVWYSSQSETSDYTTGEEKTEDFFLRNFTEQEEKLVFESFSKRRR